MSDAERRYRSTLEQEGLDENFVRSTGETNESQSSENTDADGNSNIGDHNFETDTQHRYTVKILHICIVIEWLSPLPSL